MAVLSPVRAAVPTISGLALIHRGKVRDSYMLPDGNRLPYVTDGISIFDFVLNALVPQKGYVLNALSHFWFKHLESRGFDTHMIAAGAAIDAHLPEALRGNPDLQMRAMAVRPLRMIDREFIGRNCLTGSVLAEYRKTGTVNGKKLHVGLQDGDAIGHPLFTPTTKAEEGHDEPLDPDAVKAQYPDATFMFLFALSEATRFAATRGVLLADSKGELGYDDEGTLRFGDEWATADSSRYWDLRAWEESRKLAIRKAPAPFDKQFVRAWGIEHGISKLDPKSPEHLARVHAMAVPQHLLDRTTQIYRYIFWRITGTMLETYAAKELGVALPYPKRKIAIVAGSENDLPVVARIVRESAHEGVVFDGENGLPAVSVISCHRNPVELQLFAGTYAGGFDAIIGVGGKALALPGVLDALLHSMGKRIPVVGVALGEDGSLSQQAARLSIEELPGKPVVVDEMTGKAYCGPQGLKDALYRCSAGELPPQMERQHKPARLHVDLSTY